MEEDPEARGPVRRAGEKGTHGGHSSGGRIYQVTPLLSWALLLGAGSSKELEEGVSGKEIGKQMFQGSNLGCRCFRIIVILTTTGNRYRTLTVTLSFANVSS